MSLKKHAVSGFKWSISAQIGQQVTQIATLVVLSRLLLPEDYGLVGMALIVINFALLFKDLGTAAAIIQRKDLSEALISSIFWVNLILGVVITTGIVVLAPLVATLYQQPELPPILSALSISFLITSFSVTQNTILQRDLAFESLAKIQIGAYLIAAIISISAAFLGAGAWSLVLQNLTVVTITTALLWRASKWRPQRIFQWRAVRSVTSFSLNMTGFYLMSFFMWNADYFLIGLVLGKQPLGYYTLAYRLSLYPTRHFTNVLVRVTFPIYAQMQDDNARLRNAYLNSVGAVALVAFPLVLGLAAVVEPFVLTVTGDKWQPIIPVIVLLAPVGLIQTLITTTEPIYQAKNRTDLLLRWGAVRTTLSVLAFAVGLRWGIYGVAAAYALVTLLIFYPGFVIPIRLIDLNAREFFARLAPPFLNSLLMAGFLVTAHHFILAELAAPLRLIIMMTAGAAVYALSSWYFNGHQTRQILATVRVKL